MNDAERVSRAEQMLEKSCPTRRLPLVEAGAWIERVAHSEDIDPPIVVRRSMPRRLLGLALMDAHVIVVRHAQPSQLTLLHELTHCIGHADHGPSFQKRLIELVARHVSVEHGDVLRAALAV
jgi:hypothetical protein